MRNNVCELLQVGVGAQDVALAALALRDVDQRREYEGAVADFEWRKPDFDRKLASILAQRVQIAPFPHLARLRRAEKGEPMCQVCRAEPRRDQRLDRPADQLFAL